MGSSLATLRGMAVRMADMNANVTANLSPADIVNTGFVPNSEFNEYINYGYQRLYGIITNQSERYFQTHQDTILVDGIEDYPLPSDFHQLVGIDLLPGGDSTNKTTLMELSWGRRNAFQDPLIVWNGIYYKWMIIGDDFRLSPKPGNSSDVVRIHYIPACTNLVTDTDQVVTPQMYDEFITTYASIIALDKEETDSSHLKARIAGLEEFIVKTVDSRNMNSSYPINDDFDDYWGQC